VLISSRIPQVVHLLTKGIEKIKENSDSITFSVKGGEIWDEFVQFCVDNNFGGAENLSLIPGSVGAAPIQNIGAYGAEVSDLIEEVTYFNIETKQIETISNNECKFDYRNSIFKNELKGKIIITEVVFKLQKNPEVKTNYGGLNNYFSEGEKIGIKEVRDAVISIRKSKLPDYKILGNSGSFFKNVIVKEAKLCELSAKYTDLKYFKAAGGFKIPTAWLIDKAGLKAYRQKNVGVYENHALIVVNYGGATAKEIIDFATFIENEIEKQFGLRIDKEVNII